MTFKTHACLRVCTVCKLHGVIVLADGTVSENLTNKNRAMFEVARFVSEEHMDEDDALVVLQEIDDSALCESGHEVSLIMHGMHIANKHLAKAGRILSDAFVESLEATAAGRDDFPETHPTIN